MKPRYDIDLEHACPKYERAVDILGKRWTPVIVRALLGGSQRFSELSAYAAPISDRLLSERLKELEREGIVERQVFPETPVRIAYVITAKGRELENVVEAIQRWADKWEALVEETPAVASQAKLSD